MNSRSSVLQDLGNRPRHSRHDNDATALPRIRPATTSNLRNWHSCLLARQDHEASVLAASLTAEGVYTQIVVSLSELTDRADTLDFVLVDFEHTGVSGIDTCAAVRGRSAVPILVLLPTDSEIECVSALDAGADDVLVKPLRLPEVVARLTAVRRRALGSGLQTNKITCGALTIDEPSREARIAGTVVPLTRKEFDLLLLLAKNPGVVVTRDRIERQVWQGTWSKRTLDTHVSSLRSKLGDSSWVVTVRGVGFRLGHQHDNLHTL